MTLSGYGYRREMVSSFDDFPIHQTPFPIAQTGSSDPNHYDRYFFNGYSREHDGPNSLYFGLAMGLYPNRHVCDASFSVVIGGTQQVSVHASQRAPLDRWAATSVGPIRVEVIEPLQTLRIVVEAAEEGLRADLTFRRRSDAIEEPHFLAFSGQRVVMDYTRLTQFGRWEGWVEVGGTRHTCTPSTTWGSRDRSWGVRPVGERVPIGAPQGAPQFYWLWAPVSFDSFATHFDINEHADGQRWHESGFIVPDGAEPAATATPEYRITWRPGTRYMESFRLELTESAGTAEIELEPIYDFLMCGLGYGHPEWSHGVWKGELAVGSSAWTLPVDDPCALDHLHVQTLCRASYRGPLGEHEGIGILESFPIGEHRPTQLSGLAEPAGAHR